MSLTDFQRMVMKGENMRIFGLLQGIARDKEEENIEFGEMITELRDTLRIYLSDAINREAEILNKIGYKSASEIKLYMRRNRYPSLKGQLGTVIKNIADAEILIDAHDLSIKQNIDVLNFVTSDKDDIKKKEEEITDLLQIREIIYLKDFLNN